VFVLGLLIVRVVLDLATFSTLQRAYRLELAYAMLFAVAGAYLLAIDPENRMWAWLSLALALYGVVAFFVRRANWRKSRSGAAI
jgi:surface polysaccharide O-acyltransferase-like enzyme